MGCGVGKRGTTYNLTVFMYPPMSCSRQTTASKRRMRKRKLEMASGPLQPVVKTFVRLFFFGASLAILQVISRQLSKEPMCVLKAPMAQFDSDEPSALPKTSPLMYRTPGSQGGLGCISFSVSVVFFL